MSKVSELWQRVSQGIQESPRQLPSAVAIPLDHIDKHEHLQAPFEPDQHYFQVRVNEMYLTAARKWFNVIDPLVFVVSEFNYGSPKADEVTVPFVVGPSLVNKHIQQLPQGMLFRNTRVAGLHPFRGGRLTLTVVLCQVTVGNVAKEFLKVLESTANALDFSTALSSYVKVAGVLLDGFEAMMRLGNTAPLVGWRDEFDADVDAFTPGYFALIDAPAVSAQTLWVCDGQLAQGPSPAEATPYRDADFVLFSIVRPPDNQRSDISTLPFHPLWQRVDQEAGTPNEEAYRNAKANMVSLYETMRLSPDLTRPQAEALADEYTELMVAIHKRAVKIGRRGPKSETADEITEVRNKAVSILDL